MRRASVAAMANAHSHAFQLDLRGVGERPHPGDDFWSWRNEMYRLAGSHDPDSMRAVGERVYAQMAAAGYGAVGEFHYVVHQPEGTPYAEPNAMAIALAEAAVAQGLEIVLLPAAYNRGGFGRPPDAGQRRFCDADVYVFLERLDALRSWASDRAGVGVGVAVHSVRAVPADWIEAIASVHRARRSRPSRARVRAGPRAGGVRRRARLLADRAARADRLSRPADERRALDPRDRSRHRAARRQRLDRDHLPDHRGQPRRRLRAGDALPRRRGTARDRDRLAGPDRPIRGAARDGDARAARAPDARRAARVRGRRPLGADGRQRAREPRPRASRGPRSSSTSIIQSSPP